MKMIDKIKEYIGKHSHTRCRIRRHLELNFLEVKDFKELLPSLRMFLMTKKKEFGQVINLLKTSAEEKKCFCNQQRRN
jgi:phenylalanyl-tRNA synthetase alpha chain